MTQHLSPVTVAIVTMTLARTHDEEEQLLHSLRIATTLGLPMAIADRGGRREYVERLARLPRVAVAAVAEDGLVPQIQAAFSRAEAFGAELLLYTEPDKALFFTEAVTRLVQEGIAEPGSLRLAARSEASFATFPPMQCYTESVVNHLASELVGEKGDYSYGPFLMPRALLSRVGALPSRLGWGWRFAIFRAAHQAGIPVRHVVDDLPCPLEQREEDARERAHRIRQLSENLLGLVS